MSAFNKFNQFVEDIAKKVHNLDSDVLKLMLSNSAPLATNAIKADITDIAAANGYVAGGTQAAFVSGAQTAGTYKLVLGQVVFTAAGGSFGPFRYVVLYNDTQTTPVKPLIGWWDYGSSISLNDTETFTVALDQTNGVLTLA